MSVGTVTVRAVRSSDKRTIVVVGSGPAGVSCAAALVRAGVPVTLLDVGETLETDRQRAVETLAESDPDAWDPSVVAYVTPTPGRHEHNMPAKLSFGSDFFFRSHAPTGFLPDGVIAKPSFALGGLSNVWGAAALPYSARELVGWPLATGDLDPHYRSAAALLHLASRHDALESVFPLHCSANGGLSPSPQAVRLLDRLASRHERLAQAGLIAGASRLAVRTSGEGACRSSGLCLHGCPYGAIYNSASTLRELLRSPLVRYEPRIFVERFAETPRGVTITARSLPDGGQRIFYASRVFLAAGIYASTRVILASLEMHEEDVALLDSQYFLLPLVTKRTSMAGFREAHTLAQAFLEIDDPKVSKHLVHLQIYTYSDLLEREVRAHPLFALLPGGDRGARRLTDRLLVIQGYLHSDESGRIIARLEDSPTATLTLRALERDVTGRVLRRVVRKLVRHSRTLGFAPIGPLLMRGRPGQGFHTGGALPMSLKRQHMTSDLLGRPYGFERLHVVDATVFPTIPATTITLSVMANAHRIGTLGAQL